MEKCSHTSLPTSPPLRATLALLIGEQIQHPTPIRCQHEQEELRKLRLNPEDAQHAADLHGSHGHETAGVSHMPRRISRDLTKWIPAPLEREAGALVVLDRNKACRWSQKRRTRVNLRMISEAGGTFQRDKYCVCKCQPEKQTCLLVLGELSGKPA